MPKKLTMMDAVFLAGESRESMMHVGALFPFTPPADAAPGFLRALTDELRASARVCAPWNLKLRFPELLKNPLQSWVEDDDFDIDYHVRRSALPSPGDERELGILVSRLHGASIDFHRPPWELHIIEGLEGGRFALYFKIHHALVDGYTGMKMLAATLSTDPADRSTPMFFAQPPRPRRSRDEDHDDDARPEPDDDAAVPTLDALFEAAREQAGAARVAGRALMNVVRSVRAGDHQLVAPMQAPRTIFNRRISRNRRFATQQYAIDRLRRVAHAVGGTVNDACLALCGAALRRYLLELDALPDEPLIAMLPVNVRPKDDPGGGNAVGSILASLATDLEDPVERLHAIVASTHRAKEQLRGMSKNAILQYSAMMMAPLSLQQLTFTAGRMRPAFNLVISNVPGPTQPLYFRGARMEALYPLSIPFHGYGLNITINGYIDTLNFGFTGCRVGLPHLQRLAVYAGDALEELEAALPDAAAATPA
ncbi:MAG: wax ester/triacylglycerol synthase family O-acyltransferase [Kofleriaceae bacterium]|nr:wax ester/triacylglycerol synthase family O-acyltransferase [Kofleriaceae bacterium]